VAEADRLRIRVDRDAEVLCGITLPQPAKCIVACARSVEVVPRALVENIGDASGVREGRTPKDMRPRFRCSWLFRQGIGQVRAPGIKVDSGCRPA
jgi:hypothetical protein